MSCTTNAFSVKKEITITQTLFTIILLMAMTGTQLEFANILNNWFSYIHVHYEFMNLQPLLFLPFSLKHSGKGNSIFWRWRVKNRLIQNLLSDGVLVVQRLQCQKFIQWHYVTYMWKWIHDQIAQFWHRGRHFMWHFVLLQHDTCCHLPQKYCCLFHRGWLM